MNRIKLRTFAQLMALLVLIASCGSGEQKKKIKIGYTNWADCIAITYLTKNVLTDQGYDVELLNADAAPIYASISTKKIDVFMDMWIPVTHKDYMDQYGDKLEGLGTVYDDARIGLVVPEYVTINSIEELNVHKDRFDSNIIGIDAGSGIMKVTDQAIPGYGLDFNLLTSSGPAMTASLKRAIDEEKWMVVTGWTPHWMFERFKLKMLEELRFILDTVSISPYLNKQIGKVRKIVSANAESNTSELIEIVSQILKISADKSEELLILSTKEKTSIDEYQSMLESGEGMQDDKLEDKLKSDCLNPEDLMLEQENQAFAMLLADSLDDILSHRQAEYIRMYFGIGCAPQTFEQIGEEFCVNAGTVEKGVKSALKKLKEYID